MPDYWPSVPLGEVLIERRETPQEDDLLSGRVRIVAKIGFNEGRIELREGGETKTKMIMARPGDLVVSGINAAKGAIAIYGQENKDPIAATIHYGAYIPRKDRVDARYLWWLLRSSVFKDLLMQYVPGGIKTELKATRFLPVPVPLPSLLEQHQIVARIEELSVKIAEARNLRCKASDEAEALYSRQLSVAMTPHGEGWKRETVADVIQSIDAGWSPQCDDIAAVEGQWGVLKTTAVQWCEFQPHHNKALPLTFRPVAELAVKKGDVLVTRAGPRKRVGVVAAVRRDESRLMISDKLIRLRTDCTKIEPRFLELSLASPFSQEHFVQRKTGLADAQVNISQEILRTTPVSYPQLPEQHRIVAELDALQAKVDELKVLQAATSAELDALLPSILDRAFKGEL